MDIYSLYTKVRLITFIEVHNQDTPVRGTLKTINMRIIILLSSIWIMEAALSKGESHALYLSLTEIKIEQDTMKVVVKVFSDDLRDALKNHDPQKYRPSDLSLFFSKNKMIAIDYFNDNLKLHADNSRLTLTLEEHSVEGDAHFISFRSYLTKPMKTLSADATYLMELFPTQLNVIKVYSGENTYFLKFANKSGLQSVNL